MPMPATLGSREVALKYLVALTVALAPFLALASTPDVVPDGSDAYRIMLVGNTGFISSGKLVKRAYAQATEFCATRSLIVETVALDSTQTRPFGGFPEARLRFRCVKRDSD